MVEKKIVDKKSKTSGFQPYLFFQYSVPTCLWLKKTGISIFYKSPKVISIHLYLRILIILWGRIRVRRSWGGRSSLIFIRTRIWIRLGAGSWTWLVLLLLPVLDQGFPVLRYGGQRSFASLIFGLWTWRLKRLCLFIV